MYFAFQKQLAQGQKAEHLLGEFFTRQGFTVDFTPEIEIQRQGIDAYFTNSRGITHAVEFKMDSRTQKTGNFFIETTSVLPDGNGATKQGWIYTSKAKMLIYAAENIGIFVFPFERLRANIDHWQKTYKEGMARNINYTSLGLLVPRKTIEPLAIEIYAWDELTKTP